VYPTLCDLADLPQPKHLQGRSLLHLLRNVDASHKDAVYTRHGGGDAVRNDRYRYMEMRSQGGRGELLGVGLFDLEKDPDENRNVAEDPHYHDTRRQLKAMLDSVRSNDGA
ncbi:MAG: sulfatase/phosphatase domain-containing protein, partial [Planctomycetota bacterium]